jgi:hypothetical protein
MKNDHYKTVPYKSYSAIVVGSLYGSLLNAAVELDYTNYMMVIDWKTAKHIEDKRTQGLFEIACGGDIRDRHNIKLYYSFIQHFLARFIFENDLVLNMDAIRLFQADFLGWKPKSII